MQTSFNKASTSPTKKVVRYAEIQHNGVATIVIPQDIQNDIDHLHARCGRTEWSGLLIYEVTKGNIADPENLELTVKGIYLFDIGSPGYTEFEVGTDIIDVYEHFPQMMEEPDKWKYGKIHSHHHMKAYHSGTDVDDLHEQAPAHAYYVSLVVNFDGNYDCEIAVLAEEEERQLTHKDGSGGTVSTKIVKSSKLIRIECLIDKPDPVAPPCSDLVGARFKHLEDEAKLAAVKRSARLSQTGYSSFPGTGTQVQPANQTTMFDEWDAISAVNDVQTFNQPAQLDEATCVKFLKVWCYQEPEGVKLDTVDGILNDLDGKAKKLKDEDYDAMADRVESNYHSAVRETFGMEVSVTLAADTAMNVYQYIEDSVVVSDIGDTLSIILQGIAFDISEQLAL